MFADRADAGNRLAKEVARTVAPGPDLLVLGIPRGGVIVARAVAAMLDAPLDVVVPHKLGAPANAELAIGAVTLDGTTILDHALCASLGVSQSHIDAEIEAQRREIARRLLAFRGVAEEADAAGRRCVIVDDGMATGATAEAGARSLRARGAASVVCAVPVASDYAIARVRRAGAAVVCLARPLSFLAVGQWYRDFDQVTDGEVVQALRRPAPAG